MDYRMCMPIILLMVICTCDVMSREIKVTIKIEPSTQECFYEEFLKGQFLGIHYQVISGGQGKMDVSFHAISPSGLPLLLDIKEKEQSHRIEIKEDGPHKLCWDNTISTFNMKVVFFGITVEDLNVDEPWDMSAYGDKLYDMKIQDFEDSLKRIRTSIREIEYYQDSIRAQMARDRNIVERSFTRVNVWSMISIAAMLIIGLAQVIFMRSFFSENSPLRRLWRWWKG